MRLRRLLITAAAAGAMVLCTAAPANAAGDVAVVDRDVSQYPQVSVIVAGPTLAGADRPASDFWVKENGRVVVANVSRVDEPLDVVLAVDTSGSMAGPAIDAARAAAATFVDQMPANVRIGVLGFGPSPAVALPFSTDRAAARAALARLAASGETALYDAVGTAASLFPATGESRRAIVVLSDGGDTVSRSSIDAAISTTRAAHAALWAVSLTTSESDHGSLERLTAATGGRVVDAADPSGLNEAYRTVAGNLAGRYRLTYQSSASGAADITIQVAGQVATTEVVLPHAAIAAGPLRDPGDADGHLLAIGAGLFFVALAVALAMALAGRRRAVHISTSGERVTSRLRFDFGELKKLAHDVAERSLDRSGQRRGLEAALEQAGVRMTAGEAIVGSLTAAILGGLLFGLVGGPWAALAGVAFVLGASIASLAYLRDRRRRRFGDQLDDLLQMLAGSLRAGYALLQSVELAARELASPASDELRRLTTEVRLGRDLTESLESCAERMHNEDFQWAVQAIRIHREVGGDLSGVLDRVAETIRARAHLKRQVKALSAEGRLSAVILMILPFGVLGISLMTNPHYIGKLFSSTFGLGMVTTGVALLSIGAVWLRHLVRPEF